LQVVFELARDLPDGLLSSGEVHSSQARLTILRAQDVRAAILSAEGMTGVNIFEVCKLEDLGGEAL
jgi:hypothetical protein